MSPPHDHDVAAELSTIPGLAELPREAFIDLLPLVTSRRVPSGGVIVGQGAVSPAWLALIRGAAKSARTVEIGKGTSTVVLDVMRAPCVVPDASIYDGGAAAASVIALRASQVFAIEKRAFGRVIMAHPLLLKALLLGMVEDGRAHVRRVDEVVSGSVDERVKHLLSSLASRLGTPLGQGRFIAIPLRRRDIACMVNATTETVSRLLARFQREGLARSTRDGIWWRSSSAQSAVAPPAPPMVRENA
jgi:CRP-like cAMP-binding protein